MPTSMRRGASGWVAKILFALLILSFGAWGIVDYLQPDPDPVVIEVGDSEIRQSAYRTQFDRALEGLRRQVGTTVTRDLALQMGLEAEVTDAVINDQVLTREGEKMGMAVSDSVLRSAIASNPAFQGPTGEFDAAVYEQTLFRSGLSESRYLASLRGGLIRDPLLAAATVAPPAPDAMVDAQFGFEGEKRKAAVLYRSHDSLPAPADPGDTVLRAFYDKEDFLYQQPELRDVSAVILDPEEIARSFAIAEDAIQAEYENRRGLYHTPEHRLVAQLLLSDADAAATAVARLRAGESWPVVVGESGGTATELGELTREDMVSAELADAAFGISEPGFADPVESAFGHHVLWVKDIRPASTRPLAEVRDEIEQALALDRAIEELYDRANAVEDALAAGDGLEAAAAAGDVRVKQFSGMARTGQNAQGERPDGAPQQGQFWSVVFQTEEGENSILTESQDGGFFVVRVDRVYPETKKPFDDVRADVLRDWSEAQRAEQAEKLANELAEKLRGGADLEVAAAEAGFTLAMPTPFTRAEAPAPVTPDLSQAAFEAQAGEFFVHNDFGQVFVAKVEDVIPASATEQNDMRDAIRQALDRDRRLEVGQAFQRAIRAQYDVTVDQASIDNLLR